MPLVQVDLPRPLFERQAATTVAAGQATPAQAAATLQASAVQSGVKFT